MIKVTGENPADITKRACADIRRFVLQQYKDKASEKIKADIDVYRLNDWEDTAWLHGCQCGLEDALKHLDTIFEELTQTTKDGDEDTCTT